MTSKPPRMHAILSDRGAPNGLAIREVDRPRPAAHETLVRVAAVSLDGDEVLRSLGSTPEESPLGSDFSGTVEVAARDGSGPAKGLRVAGLVRSGAWAQFVVVPSQALAELPAKVTFARAAALPVAGLTALYALDYAGLLAAKHVLVVCGTGGIGLCALQIAQLSGACVTATVHDAEHEALLEDYGADHVVVGDVMAAGSFAPYHLVISAAGGSTLEFAPQLLHVGGTCIVYQSAKAHATLIDGYSFAERNARLRGISVFRTRSEPASNGLRRLVALCASGSLLPHIEVEAHWTEIGTLVQDHLGRNLVGKAVLHFDEGKP